MERQAISDVKVYNGHVGLCAVHELKSPVMQQGIYQLRAVLADGVDKAVSCTAPPGLAQVPQLDHMQYAKRV